MNISKKVSIDTIKEVASLSEYEDNSSTRRGKGMITPRERQCHCEDKRLSPQTNTTPYLYISKERPRCFFKPDFETYQLMRLQPDVTTALFNPNKPCDKEMHVRH